MFDEYARTLIESIPELPDIDRDACRRALSLAYLHVLSSDLSVEGGALSEDQLTRVTATLRGLGDALESVAVFDMLSGIIWPEEDRRASAFVAAESLSLLSQLLVPATSIPGDWDPICDYTLYVVIEAALLYMIGGYDINAVALVYEITQDQTQDGYVGVRRVYSRNARYLLNRLLALCRGDVRQKAQAVEPVRQYLESNQVYEDLLYEIRARLYQRIGDAVDDLLLWLGGYKINGYEISKASLEHLRQILGKHSETGTGTVFADLYHLSSILSAAFECIKRRALLYNMPHPENGQATVIQDYRGYLVERARGNDSQKGRPFLWPSSIEYINACLPGPQKDAVLAMPTGSGKSFIAELAVSQAICSGWVLYLVPTNALAYQVRRELKQALRPFQEVTVRAFVGAEEYTTLSEEYVGEENGSFVAVMTPEKCALAVRLYPERFEACRLCVFDECHLLNDERRGLTADILLAQLIQLAPHIRFLLMSAMLSNANELAEWLRLKHGVESVAPALKWRPSRTLRGLVALDKEALAVAYHNAQRQLVDLPPRLKNLRFEVPMVLVVGLSGPWTREGPIDYHAIHLSADFEAFASRKPGKSDAPQYDGWKNTSARSVSELLALNGSPSLCLILSSRHHTFSSAEKVTSSLPDSPGNELPPLVDAWLCISDAELGVESALRKLLSRGICTHSSAMLQTEQAASEYMFANKKASLMFATPTLAQGLNLPAIGVVVAGSSMGDPREHNEVDKLDGVSYADATILNGFGRAGRPGFSNRGLAILVSDKPYKLDTAIGLDPSSILNEYAFLGEEDAAVVVKSPVRAFIETSLTDDADLVTANPAELAMVSLLAEGDGTANSATLAHTLGAYQNREKMTSYSFIRVQDRIRNVRQAFLERPDVPSWIGKAAVNAGTDYFRARHIWDAYRILNRQVDEPDAQASVRDWYDFFIDILTELPPHDIKQYFARPEVKTCSILTKLRDACRGIEEINTMPWLVPTGWDDLWDELGDLVLAYMDGKTYADVARLLLYKGLNDSIDNKRTSGSHPIPKVFSLLRQVVDGLAIQAGCLVSVYELGVAGEGAPLPAGLEALPLAIRNGCNSIGTLAWYRFGYRQRVCAHAFEAAFPLPNELDSDAERARWVIEKRREWLNSPVDDSLVPILEQARIVIREGGEL